MKLHSQLRFEGNVLCLFLKHHKFLIIGRGSPRREEVGVGQTNTTFTQETAVYAHVEKSTLTYFNLCL